MHLNNLNYDLQMSIKDKIRIVKYAYQSSMILPSHKRKRIKPVNFLKNNNCDLITCLISITNYSDELLLEYYKSRWDVEIFFKSIKYNTTFQNMNEKDTDMQYQKDYLCILIIE